MIYTACGGGGGGGCRQLRSTSLTFVLNFAAAVEVRTRIYSPAWSAADAVWSDYISRKHTRRLTPKRSCLTSGVYRKFETPFVPVSPHQQPPRPSARPTQAPPGSIFFCLFILTVFDGETPRRVCAARERLKFSAIKSKRRSLRRRADCFCESTRNLTRNAVMRRQLSRDITLTTRTTLTTRATLTT